MHPICVTVVVIQCITNQKVASLPYIVLLVCRPCLATLSLSKKVYVNHKQMSLVSLSTILGNIFKIIILKRYWVVGSIEASSVSFTHPFPGKWSLTQLCLQAVILSAFTACNTKRSGEPGTDSHVTL